METIILTTVNGYDLSVVKRALGTTEFYAVNIEQNEDSFIEINHNTFLGANNLEDIKFYVSVPSRDLTIAEIDGYIKELKDAKNAIEEFNKHIQLSIWKYLIKQLTNVNSYGIVKTVRKTKRNGVDLKWETCINLLTNHGNLRI